MKRMFLSVTVAALLFVLMAVGVSAMTAVGNVDVPFGTPAIDGEIGEDEWANAAEITFDSSNSKAWTGVYQEGFKADVKVMYDADGFYFCGKITDSDVMASNAAEYNGDGFQISLDVDRACYEENLTRGIFYSFGYNADNYSTVICQESANNRTIFDGYGANIKTFSTADGWAFELGLPWNTLVEDVKAKVQKDVIVEAGLEILAQFCYIDKDSNGNLLGAWGTTLNDENAPYSWAPKDHGIAFKLLAADGETEAVTEAEAVESESEADSVESETEAESGAEETDDVKEEEKKTNSTAIIVAIVVLALAVVAIAIAVVSKKKAK